MSLGDLDLSKRRYELERLFGSVINKIPDLCHPPAVRLEGEDDFFNRTKYLKLEPFRTQEAFERCVTPTLDDVRHEGVSSPTGDYIEPARAAGPEPTKSIQSAREDSNKAGYPFSNPVPECMLANGYDDLCKLLSSHDIEWRMLTPTRPSSEYEERYFDKLVKLYRNHQKRQWHPARGDGSRGGGDQMSFQPDYNAPPLPPPPHHHYHHHHQQQRFVATFRHTRHGVLMPTTNQLQRSERDRDGRTLSSSVSLGVRLKGRFHSRSRTSITGLQAGKFNSANIPILTFTAEDENDDDESDDEEEKQEKEVEQVTDRGKRGGDGKQIEQQQH